MIILGIETSCDETAAAIARGQGDKIEILSNVVSSQIEIHKKYGGVVPEVAAREHVLNILPVVNEALEKAGIKRGNAGKKINAIAVTVGPGLITSLIVGVETAKVLSYVWNVPVIGVNHIEGHIYANWLRPIGANYKLPRPRTAQRGRQITNYKKIPNSKFQIPKINFPAVVLTVSGGHTMLVLMEGHGKYKIIGETRDDAAGEAFDKAAKLLKLGYPGGPEIAKYAENFLNQKSKISLPRPMIYSKDYDFSFSGLKTALLYEIRKDKDYKSRISEYCYEFQQAVIDVLIHKTVKAAEEYGVKTIMLAGGVAANKELRSQLKQAVKKSVPCSPGRAPRSGAGMFYVPRLEYTTDNAAMVAAAGYYKALKNNFTPWRKLKVDANLELK
ncbi:MAG: tRNA (adenosine(37)-N6)-threonylcarbamoyltransferase complex transferase subunit TsaD [bacterium]|nr:tRNA (adenosine(37)-N6)-threonylcarbamoyltransferase complex transferase subunit TsaD [bacterium]